MSIEANATTAAEATRTAPLPLERPFRYLSWRHMQVIDDALATIGAFGEVRLIKNRGKLRFIQTVRSDDLAAQDGLSLSGLAPDSVRES